MIDHTWKRRRPVIAALAIAFVVAGFARGDIKTLANAFSTDDAFARAVAFETFEREVPPDQRADALASIWEAAATRKDRQLVSASVLAYLYNRTEAQLAWTSKLRSIVKSGAQSESADVRRLAVMAIIKRNASHAMRPEMLRALQDSSELIRDLALGEVARWPDYRPILNDYVKRNRGIKAHSETVARARVLLDKGGIK